MREKFPEDSLWMDGRSVFIGPESPASVVMGRAVITDDLERSALSEAHARTRAERQAMTPDDRQQELTDMLARQRHYEETVDAQL